VREGEPQLEDLVQEDVEDVHLQSGGGPSVAHFHEMTLMLSERNWDLADYEVHWSGTRRVRVRLQFKWNIIRNRSLGL
jgi:hypothetical protein